MNPRKTRHLLELLKRVRRLEPEGRAGFLADLRRRDPDSAAELAALVERDSEPGLDAPEDPWSEASLAQTRRYLDRVLTHPPPSREDPFVPRRIGPYRILRILGEGAAGLVYEAWQEAPRRRVALKVLKPGRFGPERLRRFRQEVDALGRLHHPGIATIFEGGTLELERGLQPFLVMELVEGEDLIAHASRGHLSLRQRIELLIRTADAVSHAHERGVVHRDLKPDNVLVTRDGEPKVIDFGIAALVSDAGESRTRLTRTGEILGTVAYMSPEQLGGRGSRPTFASDVFALGVLSYELLGGRRPIPTAGRSVPEILHSVRSGDPSRLGALDPRLRGNLECIVGKAMEKRPQDRYPDARALADDLRAHVEGGTLAARPPRAGERMVRFLRRHRVLTGWTAALFLLLIVALALALRSRAIERDNAKRANRLLYRSAIAAASYALSSHDLEGARSRLESLPDGSRGWEWSYVRSSLESWLYELQGTAAPTGDPAFLPGGEVAVARDDRTVAVWGAGESRPSLVLEAGVALTTLCRSQPPGRIVAGTAEGRILGWDLDSGRCTPHAASLGYAVERMDCAEDGTLVAYGYGTLLVIRPDATSYRIEKLGHLVEGDVAVNRAGTRVAVMQRDWNVPWGSRSEIVWIDPRTGERAGKTSIHGEPIAVTFTPDGKRLVVGDRQRSVVVVDARTFAVERTLLGHAGPVTSVAVSPDGKEILSASEDGTIRMWDAERGSLLGVYRHGWETPVAVAANPANRTFVAAARDGRGMRCWSLDPTKGTILRGHSSYVYSAVFSPDGSLVASAGYRGFDPSVRLWDPLTGELLATFDAGPDKVWATFSPDGTRLLFGDTQSGHADALDWVTRERHPHGDHSRDADIEEDVTSETLEAWRSRQACYLDRAGEGVPQGYMDTGFSRDGRWVARRADSSTVEVRDARGELVRVLEGRELFGHPDFSPDGRTLACGSLDHDVYLWEWQHGSEPVRLEGHTGSVYNVRFHPDGSRFASCGNDNRILVWDSETLDPMIELRGHTRYVFRVEWSPDGTMLASSSGDLTVRIWDSVPRAVRYRQARAAARDSEQVRPQLERWVAERGFDEAARLWQETPGMTPSRRASGRRVLLELCRAGARGTDADAPRTDTGARAPGSGPSGARRAGNE